jgi:hypothetical protein
MRRKLLMIVEITLVGVFNYLIIIAITLGASK